MITVTEKKTADELSLNGSSKKFLREFGKLQADVDAQKGTINEIRDDIKHMHECMGEVRSFMKVQHRVEKEGVQIHDTLDKKIDKYHDQLNRKFYTLISIATTLFVAFFGLLLTLAFG